MTAGRSIERRSVLRKAADCDRSYRTELGIADRLVVVDGGDLDKILACGRAVVTVNSTVGSLALADGLPVIALGKAVYDIPGLTHQGELAEFWECAEAARGGFVRCIPAGARRALSDPGVVFQQRGLRLAVEAAVDRLEAIDFAPPMAASSANDPAML